MEMNYLNFTKTLSGIITSFKNGETEKKKWNIDLLWNISLFLNINNPLKSNGDDYSCYLPTSIISVTSNSNPDKTDKIESESIDFISNGNKIPFIIDKETSGALNINSPSFHFINYEQAPILSYSSAADESAQVFQKELEELYSNEDLELSMLLNTSLDSTRFNSVNSSTIRQSTFSQYAESNCLNRYYSTGISSNVEKSPEIPRLTYPPRAIKKQSEAMSGEYIDICFKHYNKMVIESEKYNECSFLMMINLIKKLLFENGISDTLIYSDVIKPIKFKHKSISFEDWWNCFERILKLRKESGLIKYIFLLNLIGVDKEEYINDINLALFLNWIRCKIVNEKEISFHIVNNWLSKYKELFLWSEKANIESKRFSKKKLGIVLETFYL